MDLRYLLRPKSVAVVGASEKPGFSRTSCLNMLRSDLGDKLYFVNPGRDQVFGKKCVKSLTDIGEPVDMIIVATPMATINSVLAEAAQCGVRGAVVYASGYSETGEEGKLAEKELKELAIKHGIAVMGPNCAGFINTVDNIPSFALGLPDDLSPGSVGLVAQSGQVCGQLINVDSLRLTYAISAGNSTVVEMEDYLEFLVEDEHTTVIAAYLEGIKNPVKFGQVLARAAELGKPVVMLKAGSSEKGQKTTTAHTGSLAGSDTAFDAVFKKFGVIRVYDMAELINACHLLATLKSKVSVPSIAMFNFSGGEAAISADLADRNGIDLADFQPETLNRLAEILPSYATPNNPVDTTATLAGLPDKYKEALEAVMADPGIGMLVIGLGVPEEITDANRGFTYGLAERIVAVASSEGAKPVVIMPASTRKRAPEVGKYYGEGGVPIMECPSYALSVIRKYIDYSQYDTAARTMEIAALDPEHDASAVVSETLSEHDSKQVLKKYGIPIADGRVVNSEQEAKEAAEAIGYPLVLKIDSPDIPHKTDIGGVKLGIEDDESLVQAFNEIMDNARKHKPDARLNGVLVQKMLPQGTEIIVGINRDPQLGPMVLVGLGGIFVELFKDVSVYPAPLGKNEALEMIKSLKGYPLLSGYRGAKPLDVDALADTIVKVAELAVENKYEISELDINPLFVYPEGEGVGAADALVVKG